MPPEPLAGMGVLNAAIYGGGVLAKPIGSSRYAYTDAPKPVPDAVAAMKDACLRNGTDLATAALQFSMRAPFVDSMRLSTREFCRRADRR